MMLWSAGPPAPNPRRVTIFAAEKGIALPTTDLAIFKREHKAPEFVAKNPRGQVPALELDDGTVIAESISICRYLDALHPDPPLFGAKGEQGALDRALVDVALRRVETVLGTPLSLAWVYDHPYTAAVFGSEHKAFGASNRPRVVDALAWFDGHIGAFVAGEAFTIADIALWCAIDFGHFAGLVDLTPHHRLTEWFTRVSARPSVIATGGAVASPVAAA